MGLWGYYFFLKLFLYLGHYIGFHLWPNLAFAVFLAWPLPKRGLRIARHLIAVPIAVLLLYHDSWLPPLGGGAAQLDVLTSFTPSYMIDLVGRFINLKVCTALAVMLAVYWLLSYRLRMSSFAVLAMLLVPALQALPPITQIHFGTTTEASSGTGNDKGSVANTGLPTDDAGYQTMLEDFFKKQAPIKVPFPTPAPGDKPFDIIFLQICSLAWDDLKEVHEADSPFIKGFDALFTDFNTATSYSGPAALRLLRAPCGQEPHDKLYQAPPDGCYLSDQLRQAGYTLAWTMPHDGSFDNFRTEVETSGGWHVPLQYDKDLPATYRAFDGTGLKDDYDVLSRWWKQRLKNPSPRVALYYNTFTMHDGNTVIGQPPMSNVASYAYRTKQLFSEFGKLFDLIRSSGRNVVVVFVPEHGDNLQGDRMQISGLREIPTPAITDAPLGIKLIGPGYQAGAQVIVDPPTSFVAMSQLLAKLLAQDPFNPGSQPLSADVQNLTPTPFVAQNQGNTVMKVGDHYMMRGPGGNWTRYVP